MELLNQILWLLIIAIPVAYITWTITHEEIFRELIQYCERCSRMAKSLPTKKFYFLFTCEFCLSHYVTILVLLIMPFQLLYNDWRGYLLAGISLVWIANIYMSLFYTVRIGIKSEKKDIQLTEEIIESEQKRNRSQKKKKVNSKR